ncbi:hypothetical protein [Streptomyces diastatochromogenes]|uniref:hypothetical protein n=1 Tax=Streptomyces diastatochromogenes TaxID=42236 RepID=UPI00313423C3
MAIIDRDTETALDAARDRYGRTINHDAAAAARTRRTQAALAPAAASTVCLRPGTPGPGATW